MDWALHEIELKRSKTPLVKISKRALQEKIVKGAMVNDQELLPSLPHNIIVRLQSSCHPLISRHKLICHLAY